MSVAMDTSSCRQSPSVRVSITDAYGGAVRDPGLARWLAQVAPRTARGRVTVALVSDATVRRLNRRFARHDSVTDVLSFPTDPEVRQRIGSLGDIVIATGRAGRQAREAGHSLRTELRVLSLHGLLHLLGYDHHGDAGRMARFERHLLRKGGVRAGLIERAERT